jgi:hypothetical protein
MIGFFLSLFFQFFEQNNLLKSLKSMFLKKRVVKFCSMSPPRFLVLLEIDFITKMDLQKIRKKMRKLIDGKCKR